MSFKDYEIIQDSSVIIPVGTTGSVGGILTAPTGKLIVSGGYSIDPPPNVNFITRSSFPKYSGTAWDVLVHLNEAADQEYRLTRYIICARIG